MFSTVNHLNCENHSYYVLDIFIKNMNQAHRDWKLNFWTTQSKFSYKAKIGNIWFWYVNKINKGHIFQQRIYIFFKKKCLPKNPQCSFVGFRQKHILSHLKINIKQIVMLTFSLYQRTKYTFTTKNVVFFGYVFWSSHAPILHVDINRWLLEKRFPDSNKLCKRFNKCTGKVNSS